MAFNPKTINPKHLMVLRLHFQGLPQKSIAKILGLSQPHISNIIHMPEAQELLEQYRNNVFESLATVQETLQAAAPMILNEKISLALTAADPRVRSMSCTDLLNMAGHKPTSKVIVERDVDPHEKYAEMSEEELRKEVMKGLTPEQRKSVVDPTVH